jgi:Clp amino terminal domain, pathogenicity island component
MGDRDHRGRLDHMARELSAAADNAVVDLLRTTLDAKAAVYPFERFTERAKKVLTLAQNEAERSGHPYVGTEHLLLGLLRENEGLAGKVLNNLGVEIDQVRQAIETTLGRNPRILIQQLVPTSRVKKVIELSFEQARHMGHNYVGTEHILLGLIVEGEGIAAHVLMDLGVTEAEEAPRVVERRTHKVGQRVLVHEPDPPYRMWEGRIVGIEQTQVAVRIPGRAAGEEMIAAFDAVHSIPMLGTRDCSFCRAE